MSRSKQNRTQSPSPDRAINSRHLVKENENHDEVFSSVQEMFAGQIEADVIHLVLTESDWNGVFIVTCSI